MPYIRAHSQETAPEVVQSHIGLYVNDFSRNLGDEGMAAITAFLERGRQAGVLPPSAGGGPLFACQLGREK
jgi:1,4-dihydroxy-6-naphthoate synthase